MTKKNTKRKEGGNDIKFCSDKPCFMLYKVWLLAVTGISVVNHGLNVTSCYAGLNSYLLINQCPSFEILVKSVKTVVKMFVVLMAHVGVYLCCFGQDSYRG